MPWMNQRLSKCVHLWCVSGGGEVSGRSQQQGQYRDPLSRPALSLSFCLKEVVVKIYRHTHAHHRFKAESFI